MGSDRHADQQEGKDQGQAQATQADHDDEGRRQQQQDVFQYAVFQSEIPRRPPAAAGLSKA